MEIISSLLVGLIAGVLASRIVGRIGFGLVGDLLLGMAGGLVGAYAVARMGWQLPFGPVIGAIAVSLIGAAVVLVVAHAIDYAVLRRRIA